MNRTESQQRERVAVEIAASADEACRALAQEIAELIRRNDAAGRPTVLGLATGSTPVRLYRQLIRLHREEKLSFRSVVTFNLDEYYGLNGTHPESYRRFMSEQLFQHIDIRPENTHVPDGTVARADVYAYCARYEEMIRAAGGIDLQILGIGRTGHIGFNEPGSTPDSRTRLVTLDALTRRDAARDFLGEANVPRHAITMGVGTVLDARQIVLMAWGEAKAGVLAQAVEGPQSDALPASLLQRHRAVRFIVDRAASGELTRVKHPWLVGPVKWEPKLVRRAVVWLSGAVKKPVLKLVDEDYSEHGMAELLTEQGPAYDLNIRIFNQVQHTITGWPGGKPHADDTHRPERAQPSPKRVLVLSPEPSDDVLGMGGTIRRLIDHKNVVTVVYQTSGNLAVPDEEARMATQLVIDLAAAQGSSAATGEARFARAVEDELARKHATGGDDTPAIRRLKGLLRRGETHGALKLCGVPPSQVRFLDLPFYERGRYRQFQVSADDVAATVALLREVQPHQVFATGDRADPSSVAAVAFEVLRRAFVETAGDAWRRDCRVWLYRVPEKDWPAAEIDMAVPLSPHELAQKINAAFHHKSQRSQSPGADLQEGWQQAEQRNRALAALYDRLGLAEYEALEAFERGEALEAAR
jgi:glucosamine-6-phosphate deaminase